MISISNISNTVRPQHVSFKAKTEKVKNIENVNSNELPEDSLEIQHKEGKAELTKADKQQILSKARAKAAGWSIFGEVFSTLYYGLRSDKTVAKKFDLDPEKDKKLIKKIKRDQILATLPSALVPSIGGIAAYLYCKNQDPENIDVD